VTDNHPRMSITENERASRNASVQSVRDLKSVYQEHVHFVWRVVRRLGVPDHSVSDVVQDVFLIVHRRLPDFDNRAPMRAWLAGICRGVTQNHLRSIRRREARLRLVALDHGPATDGAMERADLGRQLGDALDELEDDQRLAIVLIDIEGLTPAEVADIAGVSRNTIYSRLRLARRKLRMRLESSSRPIEEHDRGGRP